MESGALTCEKTAAASSQQTIVRRVEFVMNSCQDAAAVVVDVVVVRMSGMGGVNESKNWSSVASHCRRGRRKWFRFAVGYRRRALENLVN
jgi:hypothetical protein